MVTVLPIVLAYVVEGVLEHVVIVLGHATTVVLVPPMQE